MRGLFPPLFSSLLFSSLTSSSLLASSSLVLPESEGEAILREGEREGRSEEGRRRSGRTSSRFYPRLQLSPRLGLHIVPYTRLPFGIPSTFGFLTSFARTVSLFFSLLPSPRLPSSCVTLLSSLRPYLAIEIRACRAHTERRDSSLEFLLTRSCPSFR